jgi:hypothetical protein
VCKAQAPNLRLPAAADWGSTPRLTHGR